MFATRPNFSTAGVLVPIPVFTVGDEDFAPNCTATLTFFTDGTISGAGSLTSYTGNWYLPSTASIGSIYYIKLTVLPGNTITSSGAATGSYLLMSSNRQWTWAMGSTVGIRSANIRIDIATAASDSNIVATTGTIPVNMLSDV